MTDRRGLESDLARVSLFSGLDGKELKAVASLGREVSFGAGHEIVGADRPGVAFFVILEGRATVNVRGESRGELGPGNSFGEIALLDGQPRSATITAVTDVRCFSIVAWAFGTFLENNPKVSIKLLRSMAQRVRELEHDTVD